MVMRLLPIPLIVPKKDNRNQVETCMPTMLNAGIGSEMRKATLSLASNRLG